MKGRGHVLKSFYPIYVDVFPPATVLHDLRSNCRICIANSYLSGTAMANPVDRNSKRVLNVVPFSISTLTRLRYKILCIPTIPLS